MEQFFKKGSALRWSFKNLSVIGCIILCSQLAYRFFGTMGYITIVWAIAGVSLTGVLLFGKKIWPGIFVATTYIGIEALSRLELGKGLAVIIGVSLLIALGEVLQATGGAMAIRRFLGFPHRHDHMKDIFLMVFVCGPISCLFNATIGTSILSVAGFIPRGSFQNSWFIWWVGGFFGIVVILPLASAWTANMINAGKKKVVMVLIPLFLVITTVIVASNYTQKSEWKKETLMFKRRSSGMAESLWNQVGNDIEAVYAVQSLFEAMGNVARPEFTQFVDHSLRSNPSIQALEWIPKVAYQDRNEYEEQALEDGVAGFQIREIDTEGQFILAAFRSYYFPAYYLEPIKGNERVLGFDLGSDISRRQTLTQAMETGELALTPRIELVQEKGLQYGVLAFAPVFQDQKAHTNTPKGMALLRGFSLGVFNLSSLVEHALKPHDKTGMTIWLMDDSADTGQQLLFSNEMAMVEEILPVYLTPEKSKKFSLYWQSEFNIAGRKWSIHFFPTTEFIETHKPILSWTVLGFGFILISLLGSFLIIVIGRAMITEELVIARTRELSSINTELEQEISEREQAESRLRKSDSRVHAIMDNVDDGIITISELGIVESMNPGAEHIFGYEKAEVIGQNVKMLMPEPFKRAHDQYLKNYRESGIAKIIGIGREVAGLKKDGSIFPLDLVVSQMKLGNELYFAGIVRDISDRKAGESKLKSSELRWKFALEGRRDGVWDWDLVTDTIFYSPRWKNMLGYAVDEIGDTPHEWTSRIHQDDSEMTLDSIANHLAGETEYLEIEHRLRCKDGSYKWISNRGQIVEWTEDGNPARFIGTHSDISQRKEREETLRRFQKAIDVGGYAIYITDIDGKIEYVNPAFTKITGYTESETLGKNPRLLKSGKMELSYYKRLWKVLLNGKIWEEEIINRKKNGMIYHAHQTIAPILNEKGVIEGFVAIQLDMTEMKQIEASLRENDALLKKAQEMSKLGSWKWDLTTNEFEVSSEIARIYGIEDPNVKITPKLLTDDMIHEDDRAFSRRMAYEVRTELAQPETMTLRIRKANGDIGWITVTTPEILSHDKDGNPTVMIGTVQDITILKEIEEELRKAQLASEAANLAKSEFLANMSHEIRTPMNAVIGFSTLLSSMITDGKQKSYLDSIDTAGKTLLTLINDILDLSKIEAGKLEFQYEPVRLSRIFDEMKQIFRLVISEKQLDYQVEMDPHLPDVLLLDETRIRQVLLNILGNAIKFTDSGYIRLSASVKARRDNQIDLEISVKDSGIGIPENQQQLIFNSFQQQEGQSTRKYGGTGLGLAISKRLVEMMDGGITVNSKMGKGSHFRINLKNVGIAKGDIKTADVTQAIDLKTVKFKPARVLVADDTATNQSLLRETLSGTGLEVIEASNGREAIEQAIASHPQVILMDLVMPLMDGFEAAQKLKFDPKTSKIPIIALTASISAETKSKINEADFDGELSKPLNIFALIGILSRYLSRIDTSPAPEENSQPTEAEDELAGMVAPEDLAKKLESELIMSWQKLTGAIVMDDVTQFTRQLSDLAQAHQAQILSRYVDKLDSLVQNFDIGEIETTLRAFPSLIEKITSLLNKQTPPP